MDCDAVNQRSKLSSHKYELRFPELEALCFEMRPYRDTIYFWTPAVEYLWTYKAEIGKRTVGGIIAMPARQGNWYINSVFVHPSHRRKGVASKLLERVLRLAAGATAILDVKTRQAISVGFLMALRLRQKENHA